MIYEALKTLLSASEWSKTMNAPTPPNDRKSASQAVNYDEFEIKWEDPATTRSRRDQQSRPAKDYIETALKECEYYIDKKTRIFPTQYGEEFPPDFEWYIVRMLKLLVNILSHFYTYQVFLNLRQAYLHTRLNKVFAHAVLLDRLFGLNIVDLKRHSLADLIPVLIDDK